MHFWCSKKSLVFQTGLNIANINLLLQIICNLTSYISNKNFQVLLSVNTKYKIKNN